MLDFLKKDSEKKVEYIELIYDLIFVYIIGRNNTILHAVENGFIPLEVFATYIISALVILQVWYSTTIFINRYGSNGWQEHLGIFVNMYLLYYMADGTRVHWQEFYLRYNAAWALILLNLALQSYLKLRKSSKAMPWINVHMKHSITVLMIQAGIIAASIPVFIFTNIPLAPLAMLFGMLSAVFSKRANNLVSADFPHLTERVMLYIVFTFGEMIIGIAGYFEGGFNFNTVYFSFMAFLIVAGLFLSYGFVYDNVIDREMQTAGTGYMLLHIFMITALNNVTCALEFMREPEVADIPKNIFIVMSLLVYFVFLFLTEKYAIVRCKAHFKFYAVILLFSLIFAGLMALCYKNSYISIAVTVLYIYSVFFYLYFNVKKVKLS